MNHPSGNEASENDGEAKTGDFQAVADSWHA